MDSPYAPYPTLSDLLVAAGFDPDDIDELPSNATLLERAAQRARAQARPAGEGGHSGSKNVLIRSFSLNRHLAEVANAKARSQGLTLNRVVNDLLYEYAGVKR